MKRNKYPNFQMKLNKKEKIFMKENSMKVKSKIKESKTRIKYIIITFKWANSYFRVINR
jgi:hypothetical protein